MQNLQYTSTVLSDTVLLQVIGQSKPLISFISCTNNNNKKSHVIFNKVALYPCSHTLSNSKYEWVWHRDCDSSDNDIVIMLICPDCRSTGEQKRLISNLTLCALLSGGRKQPLKSHMLITATKPLKRPYKTYMHLIIKPSSKIHIWSKTQGASQSAP